MATGDVATIRVQRHGEPASEPVARTNSGGSGGGSKDSGSFECNICLDLAQDPGVTLCGHLFCWPCLYKWLHVDVHSQECPICKAVVEEGKLVPLYGRGGTSAAPRARSVASVQIPSRPTGQRPSTTPQPDHNNHCPHMNLWFMGAQCSSFAAVDVAVPAVARMISHPPLVSYFSVYCPDLEPADFPREPLVMVTKDDLVLLREPVQLRHYTDSERLAGPDVEELPKRVQFQIVEPHLHDAELERDVERLSLPGEHAGHVGVRLILPLN
ncbi:hypothetical protein SETIT_7G053100v2 [Setaria italica]|uniref:E3 ubiquitin-protein ligase RMA n=1 Tax=Setaria italica TaxID=4555 RepID=A0A368RSF9_SETIT|nr:hypothetical protein SETIT_7G053100v2 [Setaria italica]